MLAAEVAEHGVATFAIEPGTIRTAMAEFALESESGRRWLPWFRTIFEQGLDVPPDRAVALVLLLASGRADLLSGRFVMITDDLPGLIELAERGQLGDLQSLRLRTDGESGVGRS